jgi:ABC-type multidrug transport system fused ATPase/permease subunit
MEGKALTVFTQDIDRAAGFMSGFTFSLFVKTLILFPLSFFVLLFNDWRMLVVGFALGISYSLCSWRIFLERHVD